MIRAYPWGTVTDCGRDADQNPNPWPFVKIELLSPLFDFEPGRSHMHVMRWTMHEVPENVTRPEALESLV